MTAALACRPEAVGMRASISLRNDMADLRKLARWLADEAAPWSLPEGTLFALDLCLQEAVDNVIRHGFDTPGMHRIDVTLIRDPSAVRAVIEDEGRPFDPTRVAAPAANRSLDEAVEGGQGVALIRRFMDEVVYENFGGRNRLTMLRAA